MSLKKILLSIGIDTSIKKIPMRDLREVLIMGGKDSPENIGFSNRMLVGNYPKYALQIGNLVVYGKLEEGSKVYEILNLNGQKEDSKFPETGKAKVRAIGTVKFNDIYREAIAKRAKGELEGLDPKDSRIDLILYGGYF